MSKVLLIAGHPHMALSNASKVIVENLKALVPGVEVNELGELYPNYEIDVEAEQAKLVAADTIIWLVPMYWFATPAIFKKWMDDVLLYGFAYGSTGDKLHGKRVIVAMTSGAPNEAYSRENGDGKNIEDIAYPLVRSIGFCGMNYVGSVTEGGMLYMPGVMPEEALGQVQAKAKSMAERIAALV